MADIGGAGGGDVVSSMVRGGTGRSRRFCLSALFEFPLNLPASSDLVASPREHLQDTQRKMMQMQHAENTNRECNLKNK